MSLAFLPVTAMVGLAAPLMLAGGLMLSLPVVAHLLSRKPGRKAFYPSLALLEACRAGQSALQRIRRRLLLALRLLAAAALVLAFAQPLWFGAEAAPGQDPAKGMAVVLVLDTSLSTRQPLGSSTVAADLDGRARRVLDALSPGRDAVGLVVAGATARTPLAGLSGNPKAVSRELDALRAKASPSGPVRADLPAALAKAGAILAEGADGRADRIILLTDLQGTQADADALGRAAAALPAGTRIDLESPDFKADGAFPANDTLAGLRVEPAVPAAGSAARVTVRVARAALAAGPATVLLEVDDAPQKQATVTLPAAGSAEASFAVEFPRAGWHRLTARLVPAGRDDALADDDAAYGAVRVCGQRQAVLVAADGPGAPETDCYFLARALAPTATAADPFAIRHLTPAELTPAALEQADCVCVLAGGVWPKSAAIGLARFLKKGGHAVFFGGDAALPANFAALETTLGEKAVPLAPAGFQRWDADGSWRRLGALGSGGGGDDAGFLAAFDPSSLEALRKVAFRRAWAMGTKESDRTPGAKIFMRWDGGAPAAATLPLACGGRITWCSFGLGLADGDLPKHGGMVALVQELAAAKPEGVAAIGRAACGLPTVFPALSPLIAGAAAPAVERILPAPPAAAENTFDLLGDLPVATLPSPTDPGLYEAFQTSAGRRETLGLLAVNVDPREGDLRRSDAKVWRAALGSAAAGAADGARADAALAVRRAAGLPVWGFLALAGLVFLGLEALVAGGIRR